MMQRPQQTEPAGPQRHTEIVAVGPMLDSLALGDAQPVRRRRREALARRREHLCDTYPLIVLRPSGGLEPYAGRGFRPGRELERGDEDDHALVGPVGIPGARAGMTLAVESGAVIPGPYGAYLAGGWAMPPAIASVYGVIAGDTPGLLRTSTLAGRVG
jgi:hypothetical protein